MKKKIAIILDNNRPLSTFPSIYNAINLFAKRGYLITLIIPFDMIVDCNLNNTKVVRFKKYKLPKFGYLLIYSILKVLITNKKYDLYIVTQAHELIAAGILQCIRKIKILYFCLEVYEKSYEKLFVFEIKKYLERKFNNKVLFSIVQDKIREKLLIRLNLLKNRNIVCVPNSYIGIIQKKSNYIRSKFNIEKSKKITLYAGGIERWALDNRLIECVKSWDNENILVLHGWSRDGFLDSIRSLIDTVNISNERKIVLSEDTLSNDEYVDLVASADIGLVWYKRDLPDNVKKIGLSSGKFSMFLRCGIPVIIPSYLDGLVEHVKKYKIGEVVVNEDSIKYATQEIIKEYDNYKQKCFNFFLDYLDFEKCFSKVFSKIENGI